MTKRLRQWWLYWLAFSLRGSSDIAPAEPLSRFITSERWIDRKQNTVKGNAFMPRLNGLLGTSIYRSYGVSGRRLWRIGEFLSKGTYENVLHGRAVITAAQIASVKQTSLSLKSDGRLPSLHRDIVGWPPNKSHQKIVAERLAQKAKFQSRAAS